MWRISVQDHSLKPRQNHEQVYLIKCWQLERDERILAPSALQNCLLISALGRDGGNPGSGLSPLGCRGYGYVNVCSAGQARFVSALEVAGCQLLSGSDVALISTVPKRFIVRSSLFLSLFVPTNP